MASLCDKVVSKHMLNEYYATDIKYVHLEHLR